MPRTPMVERAGLGWDDKVLHSLFEGPGISAVCLRWS